MNYTANYQLPQWVETDRIMMDDFNEMACKIDSGLKHLSQPTFKAAVLDSYDGSEDISIDLGRQPAMVMVGNRLGWTNSVTSSGSSSDPGHTVALPGYPGYFSGFSGVPVESVALEVTETGFLLHAGMFATLKPYYYLAFFSVEE